MIKFNIIEKIYERLYKSFGPQFWWPGETSFEIIVGAILTQNTNWNNVEKAIINLKREKLLDPENLRKVSVKKLAKAIKPSGFFNIKAKRLKNFINFLYEEYAGDLKKMAKEPLETLRSKILDVNGIGPETADSILLYALGKKAFVVDAYTKRIFFRHGLIGREDDYYAVQKIFLKHFDRDIKAWNEYHALIVRLAKEYCRTNPLCQQCPLNNLNYSLEHKCAKCHLYLPEQKKIIPQVQLCVDCRRDSD